MRRLWDRVGEPATVRALVDEFDGDIAYTTLMTVLSRLHDKGLARRRRRGRAWAYSAAVSEAEYTADAMAHQLQATPDRRAALLAFVHELSPEEVGELRRLLDDGPS